MKSKYLLAAMAGAAMVSSCFQGEPQNSECDITQVTLSLNQPEDYFYNPADTMQLVSTADSVITFYMRKGADLTSITPKFNITSGAVISPASGVAQDFSQGPVYYVVTSEDGMWNRRYALNCMLDTTMIADTVRYTFDNYELEPNGKFYVWYEWNSDETRNDCWDSGNPGYKIARSSAKPEEYPAVPVSTGGVDGGPYLKLETVATGGFGNMVNMRLAAGNLFIGSFDATFALKDQMQATCFGRTFTRKPQKLVGWYQYKRGASMQDRAGKPYEGGVIAGVNVSTADMPDIYACFFEGVAEDGSDYLLHGDDALTSPKLVALARIPHNYSLETNQWTRFEIDFDYETYGKTVDPELLANRYYKFALVMSSSIGGAEFIGAVGSTLLIDNVELICEEEEKEQ